MINNAALKDTIKWFLQCVFVIFTLSFWAGITILVGHYFGPWALVPVVLPFLFCAVFLQYNRFKETRQREAERKSMKDTIATYRAEKK
jgi:uncharacterized membrane protein